MPFVRKPKHKRHRDDSEYYYRCRNWACSRPIQGIVSISGRRIKAHYCDTCLCQEVMGGQLCPQPRKYANYAYCHIHLRCTHAGCYRDVKEYNPSAFRLCKTHACTNPHCPDGREGESAFCAAHKCTRPGCNEGVHPSERSRYCARHTCEHAECGNPVGPDGGGRVVDDLLLLLSLAPGDHRRFCDRHKTCARADCARRCYLRDDGGTAPFCGEHRCHHAGGACDRERAGGQFCEDHTCRAAACNAGFADGAGRYCAEHECARPECRVERYGLFGNGSAFCHVHKCQDRECIREAVGETGWCERHQPCSIEGCRRQRVVYGEMVTAHCELHTPPSCAWHYPKCAARPVEGGRFCDDHTCRVRDCAEERDCQVARSQACAEHRCTVEGCGQPRQYPGFDAYGPPQLGVHTFCLRHGCQARAARCMSPAMDGSRFCKRHTCAVQDCAEEARAHGGKLCPDHALTRQERMRDASRDARQIAAGVDPVYDPRRPPYGLEPGIVLGGGPAYGFGMAPLVPGAGMMPGVGYQYGPGQTRYRYQYP